MNCNLLLKRLAPVAAAALLAACGGGSYDAPEPPVAIDPLAGVPASASQSSQALVGYLNQLPPLDAEARDPMSLDSFMPPSSEDGEAEEPAGG